MSYEKWLDVVKKLQSNETGEPIYSPECPEEKVCYRYIGDPATRYGYLVAWCNSTKKGINVSRLKIPDGVEFVSMDLPEDEVNKGIPDDIEFVSPSE